MNGWRGKNLLRFHPVIVFGGKKLIPKVSVIGGEKGGGKKGRRDEQRFSSVTEHNKIYPNTEEGKGKIA